MPQIQLPIFPAQSTPINSDLAFEEREGTVWYFHGLLPVFRHGVDDIAMFRFVISQMIGNGNASQAEISRAFGVPLVSVKRAYKKFREEGGSGFFREQKPRRGHKLTEERLGEVQALLDAGMSVPAISQKIGVLPNTIHKAIRKGRLKKTEVVTPFTDDASERDARAVPSNQGERSVVDGEATMGVGTTRSMERVAVALGALEQGSVQFELVDDVPNGGVLCALAPLLAFGLLDLAEKHFSRPKGYYSKLKPRWHF